MTTDSLSFADHWGKSAHIDLIECAPDRVNNKDILEHFVKELVEQVGMIAHGPCYIDRFGSPEENLEGYSAMQFIKTSSVAVHLDEIANRAYIDLFSCKDFDEKNAFAFSKEYFKAQDGKITVLDR